MYDERATDGPRSSAVDAARVVDVSRVPVVRRATRNELRATGLLHARFLPSGFFPQLGPAFLRAYHGSFRSSPAAVALVAASDAQPVGFLVGTLDNEAHWRWVARRRGVPLAIAGAVALLRDLALLRRFARTRLRRYTRSIARRLSRQRVVAAASYSQEGDPGAATGPVAVLTHVAVAPSVRGTGTGRRLVDEFVARARVAGAREVRLVSPAGGQAPAFYRALGWRSEGERRGSDGTIVEEFRLSL